MTLVRFILVDPPYEPGDVAELSEADAKAKQYDGIVVILPVSVAETEATDTAPVELEGWDNTPADEEAEGAE